MAPWAGRIKDGLVKDSKGLSHQLPTTFKPPNAIDGFGFFSSWQDIGGGKQLLEFPAPYDGAFVIQHFEILDNALRWSLEYEANNCGLPFSLGFHPLIARDIGKGESAELYFRAKKMMERDQDFQLTGKYLTIPSVPWNDTFVEIIGIPEIVWRGAARLTIESDAPYWNIDTEDEDGISLQPQTILPKNANLPNIDSAYLESLFSFSEDL